MVFAASKVFGVLLVPSSLSLLLAVGTIIGLLGFLKIGRTLTWIAVVGLIAFGFSPFE